MARKDPRFEVNSDVPAVKLGDWFSLENVGYISGGLSTSDFVTTYEDSISFLNFYFQESSTSFTQARGMYMRLRISGAGTGSADAIRAYTEVNAALTTGGTHGLHSSVCYTASGSQAGLAAGVRATFDAAAAVRTLTGTQASLQCDSVIGTGNVVDGQKVSFIRFADNGDVAMPYLLDLSSLTAADAAAAVQADNGAVGSVYGYARVLCPGGAVGYIPIYSSHS